MALRLDGLRSDPAGGAWALPAAHLDDAPAIVRTDPPRTAGASPPTVHEWNA